MNKHTRLYMEILFLIEEWKQTPNPKSDIIRTIQQHFEDTNLALPLSLEMVFDILIEMRQEWLISTPVDIVSKQELVKFYCQYPTDLYVQLETRGSESLKIGYIKTSKYAHRQQSRKKKTPSDVVDIKSLIERKYSYYRKPQSEVEAIEKIASAIAARRGQKKFRDDLMEFYGAVCLITGSNVEDILEAAHIEPYSEGGTFDLSNGLLLRADIHTLFDLGLIGIDPDDLTIIISKLLVDTDYEYLQGEPSHIPSSYRNIPDRKTLNEHRKKFGL